MNCVTVRKRTHSGTLAMVNARTTFRNAAHAPSASGEGTSRNTLATTRSSAVDMLLEDAIEASRALPGSTASESGTNCPATGVAGKEAATMALKKAKRFLAEEPAPPEE